MGLSFRFDTMKGHRVIGHQIHAYLRAGTGNERHQVGPFLATFTPGVDHPMRNYAIPSDGAEPSADELAALVDVFRRRGLKPRLEYASGAAPNLEGILVDAGFTIEARIPLLVCMPGEQKTVDPPAGIEVADARTDRDHRDAMVVASEAYGEPGPPPDTRLVEARQAMAAAGGTVALARSVATGEPAGSGLYPVPQANITEVAAVGTGTAFRHQGVAAAVIGHLVNRAFDGGIDLVWLTAEHDPEQRAAERAGFHRTGEEMIHISR